jgi:hypothetical protein
MTSFPPEDRVVVVVEYSHMVVGPDHMVVAVWRFPFVSGNPIRIPQLSCSDSWFLFGFDTAAADLDAEEEEKKKQDVVDSIERRTPTIII